MLHQQNKINTCNISQADFPNCSLVCQNTLGWYFFNQDKDHRQDKTTVKPLHKGPLGNMKVAIVESFLFWGDKGTCPLKGGSIFPIKWLIKQYINM